MPSNKPKVVSYLEDAEKQIFDKFCDKNDYSNSQGVAHLIREQLIEAGKTDDTALHIRFLNERIDHLHEVVDSRGRSESCLVGSLEKQLKLITELQDDISKLKHSLAESTSSYFLDEEIASVTGRREQEVYEWRMGLRKPRGRRVLERLEPYEVRDGRWVKKRVNV